MLDYLPIHVREHLLSLSLSAEAISYIEKSRFPSTTPNGKQSFTVTYPCPFTGEIVELHSRDLEWAGYVTLVANPRVLFVVTQPHALEQDTKDARSRFYRPDFLVIWRDKTPPTLVETKPSSAFAARMAKHPDLCQADGETGYRLPLAEAAARELGFGLLVISEKNLSPNFLRNSRFLLSYHQHRELNPAATDEELEAIRKQVVENPGITITDLKHECTARRADLVHLMLVRGKVFMHLDLESLTEPNRVRLFPSAIQQHVFSLIGSENPPAKNVVCPYIIEAGLEFTIKGKLYRVVENGEFIRVKNPKGGIASYKVSQFVDLCSEIDAFHNARLTPQEALLRLDDDQLHELMSSFNRIQRYIEPKATAGKDTPTAKHRTEQRYIENFRKFESVMPGYGICGLISRKSERGSTAPLYPDATISLMNKIILKHYLNHNPRTTQKTAHYIFERVMKRLKMGKVPSYRTFSTECKQWDSGYKDFRRWGSRIANLGLVPSAITSPFGDPKGDRAFSVAYVDHTVSDTALNHPESKKTATKPIHTTMVDGTTQRTLAWCTRLDGPNTFTLIALLKHCWELNKCFPSIIVLDWGPDFRGEWIVNTLASFLGVTIIYRIKSSGLTGSPVESRFRHMDVKLNHRNQGSTEIMKRSRLATKAVLPFNHAVWTLKDFAEQCDKYHANFNRTPYGKEKMSPDEHQASLVKLYGNHPTNVIPSEVLDRLLLPFVKRNRRKVDKRCRIYVEGTYYVAKKDGSNKLDKLRGHWVDVRQGSPGTIFISHASIKGLIECVAMDLKYQATAEEKHQRQHQRRKDPEVEKRKEESWKSYELDRQATEAALEKKKRKPTPPVPPDETAQSDRGDNVVDFEYSQGGLVDLSGMEDVK